MILFIDDEPKKMESYVDEIEFSNYKVKFLSNIDEALDYWNNKHNNINLLILDIMMPASNLLNKSPAKDGLRTGIYFYKKVRKEYTEIPIVIFTNVPKHSDSLINETLKKDTKVLFLQKEDYLPFQLVERIDEFLSTV